MFLPVLPRVAELEVTYPTWLSKISDSDLPKISDSQLLNIKGMKFGC